MDIFEKLKSMIGCMYISDLRFTPFKEIAIELVKEITTDANQITKVNNYITGGI